MIVPMSWLKQYVDIDCDVKAFAERVTVSGSKVEGIEYPGSEISGVVVGRITEVSKHPDADKLYVTKVDAGTGEELQIVTGADNIYAGAYVPVALDGSTLADGKKIKKGKLRGIESQGMLCSIDELGYTAADYPEADPDGIYIFREIEGLAPGTDVRPIMELCDEVLDFELTSNRADCNSIIGIAREAAAVFGKAFKPPSPHVREEASGNASDMISVRIDNPKSCRRYAARIIKDVVIGPSPQWLRHRLTASGLRPINNIVDITNYVMLETGQPMHAFDIDNIAGRSIIVRDAYDDESFTTLDGQKHTLDKSVLVIADAEKAVAIGGVMGGENSMVTENASAILFESANFDGYNIRMTSKKLGLRTDASSRYEKSLDPELCKYVVNRAAELVEELNCGKVVRGIVDCYPEKREMSVIKYKPENINALLGTDISAADMELYLNRLEIKTKNNTAYVPTFRVDIEREADLAEEVARLYGYDKIKPTLAPGTPTVGKKTRMQITEDAIKDYMAAQGFCEALSYTFESPKVFDKLNFAKDAPERSTLVITNPLGEDFSIMRTQTVNAMLTSLSVNWNRRNEEAALFEVGKVFLPKALPVTEQPDERHTLTAGIYGKQDYYDLKGIVEELFRTLNLYECVSFTPNKTLPFMHPGRTAAVELNGVMVGYLGEAHPDVLTNYDIAARVLLAVIDLTDIYAVGIKGPVYKPLPKYPAVKRDIAMLVKEESLAADVLAAIREKAGNTLEAVSLFDVYMGDQIQKGYKSMAYSLNFRAYDRTLTEDEVNAVMKKILAHVREAVGAELRE